MRNMLKFHQQTVERWGNYLPFKFSTEFEEVKDPPEIFFSPVSTINIPDKKEKSPKPNYQGVEINFGEEGVGKLPYI